MKERKKERRCASKQSLKLGKIGSNNATCEPLYAFRMSLYNPNRILGEEFEDVESMKRK